MDSPCLDLFFRTKHRVGPLESRDAQWFSWLDLAERISYFLWALGIVVCLRLLVAMVMGSEVAR